jgi:hypothetical protein
VAIDFVQGERELPISPRENERLGHGGTSAKEFCCFSMTPNPYPLPGNQATCREAADARFIRTSSEKSVFSELPCAEEGHIVYLQQSAAPTVGAGQLTADIPLRRGWEMLLALLYEHDGQLTAAAPACDQQPLGNRYWEEVYPEKVNTLDSEIAYVAIDDRSLVERLLTMDFRDGAEAAEAVDAYLGLSAAPR